MYNRYVPGHDGNYRRQTVADAPVSCPKPDPVLSVPCEKPEEITQQQKPTVRSTSNGFDLGDLLLLCIVVLLLMDCDEEDSFPLLITAAAFLLLQ